MHVIKYKWNNFEPSFIVNPGMKRMMLLGSEINFTVGEKRCTGFFRDGRHADCSEKIEYGSQCNRCLLRDYFTMCFRCTGKECINEKRKKECEKEQYVIYLAAFNSMLKVGISFERRFLERMVEQGADFGAVVGRVQGGMRVRQVEQEISGALGITDRVRGDEKKRMLFCDPNVAMTNIQRAIGRLRKDFVQYLTPPMIFDLRSHYRLHNVFTNPRGVTIAEDGEIKGRVVAAKGNIIVIEDRGFFSINAHELLGREIDGGNA